MKLVLFSGGTYRDNTHLDKLIIRVSEKVNPRITFIPSSCGHGLQHFHQFSSDYRRYGVTRFTYFPVDAPFSKKDALKAFSSDIVFLSGGNTFHFLKYLRSSGAADMIQDYVQGGGLLAGMSAGSILMTPNIKTASFPEWDRDDNDVGLKNLKAMDLVRFEFFPHYDGYTKTTKSLKDYSKKLPYPLYACDDGGGIVVMGENKTFVGEVHIFHKGEKLTV